MPLSFIDVNAESQKGTGTVSKRNGSDGTGDGAPPAAGNHKAKGVSSARTPSAPPPAIRRPVGDTASKNVSAPAASKTTKEKAKPAVASKALAQKQPQAAGEVEAVKIIRKPKPAPETSTPDRSVASPVAVSTDIQNDIESATSTLADAFPEINLDQSAVSPRQEPVDVSSISLEEDNLCQYDPKISEVSDFSSQGEALSTVEDRSEDVHLHDESFPNEQNISVNQEIGILASAVENMDMNASITELVSNVPRPTGQGAGKVLSKEEATAALAERRRLAREQMEREKELERQREEQRR